ncbi:MAG: hypothetical protein WC307_04700 [Candidatus Nanoarchaeia archaeon]|jgi:hypothetical protein
MQEDEDNIDPKVRVCEVCGESGTDVVACRLCGIHFCGECGYTSNHLCFDCGDSSEESLEDEADETLLESSDLDEE